MSQLNYAANEEQSRESSPLKAMDVQNKLVCVFCWKEMPEKETDAHLFPKAFGGRFTHQFCCKSCNSYLGHEVEGPLTKNLLFSIAREKTLQVSRDKAYRNIIIKEPESGDTLMYSGGRLCHSPGVTNCGGLQGPEHDVKKRAIKSVQEKYPKLAPEYESRVRAGEKQIPIPGGYHEFREIVTIGPVQFDGFTSAPPDLLAKILIEATYLFRPFPGRLLSEFRDLTVSSLNENTDKKRFTFSDCFKSRVQEVASKINVPNANLFEVKYQPAHTITFRICNSGICYAIVTFFQVIAYVVYLGQLQGHEEATIGVVAKRIVFPFNSSEIFLVDHDCKIELLEHYDALALLTSRNYKRSILA